MPLTERARERILKTISSLCTIPRLDYLYIGYTRKPATTHAADAARIKFPFHVVLADRLTQSDAIELEDFLFKAVTRNKRSIEYRKYHPEKRDGPSRKSYGGHKSPAGSRTHSVYCTWCLK